MLVRATLSAGAFAAHAKGAGLVRVAPGHDEPGELNALPMLACERLGARVLEIATAALERYRRRAAEGQRRQSDP